MIKTNYTESFNAAKQKLEHYIKYRRDSIITTLMDEGVPEQQIVIAIRCDGDLNALMGQLSKLYAMAVPTYTIMVDK